MDARFDDLPVVVIGAGPVGLAAGLDDVEGRYLQGRYGAVPFFDRSLLGDPTTGANEHGG